MTWIGVVLGVLVATVSIAGGRNAGLLAARILAVSDPALAAALEQAQRDLAESGRAKDARIRRVVPPPSDAI